MPDRRVIKAQPLDRNGEFLLALELECGHSTERPALVNGHLMQDFAEGTAIINCEECDA